MSMCAYSILSRDVTYTPDASLDAVFADNVRDVTGELANIRMYVAAPLIVGDDQVVSAAPVAAGALPGAGGVGAGQHRADVEAASIGTSGRPSRW